MRQMVESMRSLFRTARSNPLYSIRTRMILGNVGVRQDGIVNLCLPGQATRRKCIVQHTDGLNTHFNVEDPEVNAFM